MLWYITLLDVMFIIELINLIMVIDYLTLIMCDAVYYIRFIEIDL